MATSAADLFANSDPLIREVTRSLTMASLMPAHLPLVPRESKALVMVRVGAPTLRHRQCIDSHVALDAPSPASTNSPSTSQKGEAPSAALHLQRNDLSSEVPAPEWWDTEGYVHTYLI